MHEKAQQIKVYFKINEKFLRKKKVSESFSCQKVSQSSMTLFIKYCMLCPRMPHFIENHFINYKGKVFRKGIT